MNGFDELLALAGAESDAQRDVSTSSGSERRITDYFYLPLKDVGLQLGVCTTTLKRICRDNGVGRWPFRKLTSLEKRIDEIQRGGAKLRRGKDDGNVDEIGRLRLQVLTLERDQLRTVCPRVEKDFWRAIDRVSRSEGPPRPVAPTAVPEMKKSASGSSLASLLTEASDDSSDWEDDSIVPGSLPSSRSASPEVRALASTPARKTIVKKTRDVKLAASPKPAFGAFTSQSGEKFRPIPICELEQVLGTEQLYATPIARIPGVQFLMSPSGVPFVAMPFTGGNRNFSYAEQSESGTQAHTSMQLGHLLN